MSEFPFPGWTVFHCMNISCFPYSPISGHLGCFSFWLLWILLQWTRVYTYLFKALLSLLLSICTEVELLDHMGVLRFVMWTWLKIISQSFCRVSFNLYLDLDYMFWLECHRCFFFFFSWITLHRVASDVYLVTGIFNLDSLYCAADCQVNLL